MTTRRCVFAFAALTTGLVAPAVARASGGNYTISGGTPYQQAQVRLALAASAFDWSLVQAQIAITIGADQISESTPGQIRLSGRLLSAGRFAWGVVQHEYAHQVDFFLLDDPTRTLLTSALGARAWCADALSPDLGRLSHDQQGCERFASTLAWAYWPDPDNCMRPTSTSDESAALPPAAFRALLSGLLAKPQSLKVAVRR